jgi:hypothetical protein
MESKNDSLNYAYRKVVGKHKDIENNFYSNNSLNDDLQYRF